MNAKRLVGPLLGIIISAVFLVIALYRVDLYAIGEALGKADYRLVALAAVFTLSSYAFRTVRWMWLLRPQKRIPFGRLFPVLVVGFALNNFLPGRPGEFARAIALGQKEGLPKTAGLATIVVERVADGLTLIFLLALISLGFDLPGWGRQVEGVSVLIFVVALATLLVLLWREDWAMRLFHRLIKSFPSYIGQRLAKMLASFILGLHSLRSPRDMLAIMSLSLAVWLCEAAHYFVMLAAFRLFDDAGSRTVAAGFAMVMVNLSISIPAAPGGVGPFEAAGLLALGAFKVARELALPLLLVAHGVQFALVSALGVLFIAREGIMSTRDVEHSAPAPIGDRGPSI